MEFLDIPIIQLLVHVENSQTFNLLVHSLGKQTRTFTFWTLTSRVVGSSPAEVRGLSRKFCLMVFRNLKLTVCSYILYLWKRIHVFSCKSFRKIFHTTCVWQDGGSTPALGKQFLDSCSQPVSLKLLDSSNDCPKIVPAIPKSRLCRDVLDAKRSQSVKDTKFFWYSPKVRHFDWQGHRRDITEGFLTGLGPWWMLYRVFWPWNILYRKF